MQLIKYVIILLAGLILGLSFDAFVLKNHSDAIVPVEKKEHLSQVKEKKSNSNQANNALNVGNQDLLAQIEVLTVENKKIKDKLKGLQDILGTLDKNTLSNLIDLATLEKRYLSDLNKDRDEKFISELENHVQARSKLDKNILDDFFASKSPVTSFDKVKKKLSNHIDEKKDSNWAYKAEEYLRTFFASNPGGISVNSINCLDKSCEIIGYMENYDTSKPETDIDVMKRSLSFLAIFEQALIPLIKDINYYTLLTDRIYGPYFSILENYNQQTMPFIMYIDRSARSMDLDNLRYD